MGKSKKLMSKNDIKEYVKRKGEYELYKDDLIELYKEVYSKNPPRNYNKTDLWREICKKVNLYEIYERYKENHFGMSTFEIEERFGIDKTQRRKLQKKGILKVAYYKSIKKRGNYIDAPYYDLECLHKLDKEEFYKLAEQNKKQEATEQQLKALEKARQSRECKRCGTRVKRKSDLKDGFCSDCYYYLKKQKEIKDQVKEIFANKNKYVILDTETTGLGDYDEVIEIAIIDLKGNILLDTRVDTDVPISFGAYEVHQISKEDLKGKPKFKDINETVSEILKDKKVLIFNSRFDVGKLIQSGYTGQIDSICLMHLYMDYIGSQYFVSLQNAMSYEGIDIIQNHSAVGDCFCCLELLKALNIE